MDLVFIILFYVFIYSAEDRQEIEERDRQDNIWNSWNWIEATGVSIWGTLYQVSYVLDL